MFFFLIDQFFNRVVTRDKHQLLSYVFGSCLFDQPSGEVIIFSSKHLIILLTQTPTRAKPFLSSSKCPLPTSPNAKPLNPVDRPSLSSSSYVAMILRIEIFFFSFYLLSWKRKLGGREEEFIGIMWGSLGEQGNLQFFYFFFFEHS